MLKFSGHLLALCPVLTFYMKITLHYLGQKWIYPTSFDTNVRYLMELFELETLGEFAYVARTFT